MARYEHVRCDICDGYASAHDGPPERLDTELRSYGRYKIIVKQRFWDGLPIGYTTKRLDVCARCVDRICREVIE